MSDFQKINIVGSTEFDSEGKFTVTVAYESSSANTNGVGIYLHFDSESLAVDSVTDVFPGFVTSGQQVGIESHSIDLGTADNQALSFGWSAMNADFPGSEEANLATITFSRVGDGANTDLFVTPSSVANGFTFSSNSAIPLNVSATDSIDENSGSDQVIATVSNGPSGATYELIDNTDYPEEATQVVIPDQLPATQHVYVSESTLSEDGTQVTIKVSYKADVAEVNGVGFKVNFDSSAFSGAEVSNLFSSSNIAGGTEGPELSDDGDSSTDRELVFAWADTGAKFPGVNEVDLATITFDVVDGASGATPINLTQSSGANGFAYDSPAHLVQLPAASHLSIDSATGAVSVSVDPDYEQVSAYNFTVVTSDGGFASSVTTSVANQDEVAAKFDSPTATDSAAEDAAVIFTAQANDSADASAGVTYSLSGADASLLSINENTGEVSVVGGADFESKTSYSFSVSVTDGINAPGADAVQDVTVAITNIDDTGPVFTVLPALSVDENSTTVIGKAATAVDDASDLPSDTITYSLADNAGGVFSIDAVSGAITITQEADYEAQSSYNLVITAKDGNDNTSDQAVTIAIANIDEVAPTITSAGTAANIDENSGANQVVYTAEATDLADTSDGVTFSLGGADASKFTINADSGVVTLKDDPDFEAKSTYSFEVIATDAANNPSAAQPVILLINDVADAKPIFDSGDTATSVDENTAAAVVYTAAADAVSPDGGAAVSIASYELVDDPDGVFAIDSATGEVTFAGGADFEAQTEYTFKVRATDDSANANFSEQRVTLNINNVDDTAPIVTGTEGDKNLNAYTGAGQVVFNAQNPIQGEQAIDDPSDVTSALTFDIVNDGPDGFSGRFDVDANGIVTYNLDPKLDDNLPEDQESQTIPYSLKVTDAEGNSTTLALQITISGAELNIPEFSAPAGYTTDATAVVVVNAGTDNEDTVTVVTEVSGTLSGVNDGDVIYTASVQDATPVTYAVGTTLSMPENGEPLHAVDASSAALTNGYLSVDPAGLVTIHGQPWEDGATEYNFTVTATDASGNVANQSVTLYVTGYLGSASPVTGVTYSLESSNGEALVDSEYAIDRNSGEITFVGSADYEARANYDFNVVVDHDGGDYSYGIFLAVDDGKDTGPAITSAASVSVTEGAEFSYQVTSAEDNDNDNTGVVYGVAGADASAFTIDPGTGMLSLNTTADHEIQSEYDISVTATANGFTSEQAVTVTVGDVDEYGPVFSSANAITIDENASGTIYTAAAHDLGSVDSKGAVKQEFVQNDDGTLTVKFSVDSAIYSTLTDLEVADFAFAFEAEQDGVLAVESIEYPANPMVKLVNDDIDGQINFALIFRDSSAYDVDGGVSLAEVTFKVGDPSVAAQFSVSDISLGNAGGAETLEGSSVVNYVMDAPSTASFTLKESNGFAIDTDGNVTVTDADFETADERSFTVVASDGTNTTEKTVTVRVDNLDELAPVFDSGATAVAIDENSGSGQVVYTAVADDSADISAGVTFSLEGADAEAFVIDAQSGEVTLLDNPDYEVQSSYEFVVKASDGVNNSTQAVSLDINNLDEVAPELSGTQLVSVYETNDPSTAIYDADHTDGEDTSNGVTYSLASTNTDTLTIDQNGVVRVTGSIDHETLAQYSFTVVATDDAGNATKEAITIDVIDVDETKPVFTSGSTALNIDENSGAGLEVYKIIADDSSDAVDDADLTYSLASDGDRMAFDYDSVTGVVTLSSNPNFEAKSEYNFVVRATDEYGNESTENITLKVNDVDEVAPDITSSVSAGTIVENSGTNQLVYTATANDIHSNEATSDGFTFALGGTNAAAFTIDAKTGEVRLIDNPDQDAQPSYEFTVSATDAAGHTSQSQAVSLSVSAESKVTVAHWGSDKHISQVNIQGAGKTVETDGKHAVAIDVDEEVTSLTAAREVEAADIAGVINSADALQVLNIAARKLTIDQGREYKLNDAMDFNNDGKVNDFDITMMAADINRDGKVNSRDALEILKISVRMDDALDSEWLFAEVDSAKDQAADNTLIVQDDTSSFVGFVRGDVNASWNNSENVDAARSTDKGASFTTTSTIEIPEGTVSGVVYKAAADDDTYKVTYGIDTELLTIDADSGIVSIAATDNNGVITYADISGLDANSFKVTATDADGNVSEHVVNVSFTEVDNDAPVITVDADYAGNIIEGSAENQVVYKVEVESNESVVYSLGAGSDPALSVNAQGEVVLSNKADEDIQSEYHFTLIAEDVAGNVTKGNHVVVVEAADEVDPIIVSGVSAESIDEHVNGLYQPQVIYKAKATDTDHDGVESISYSLAGPDNLKISSDGVVTLTNAPDYEAASEISFTVIAEDAAGNTAEKDVTIAVNNLDESAPVFAHSEVVAESKAEHSGAGQLVYTASADDSDDISHGVTYSISGTDAQAFTIDAKTGEVRLIADPDSDGVGIDGFTGQDNYSFIVTATDVAGHESTQTVSLDITDIDEVAPTIVLTNVASSVDENIDSGHIAFSVSATDNSGDTPELVLSSDSDKAVSLDDSGNIVLNESPDHEMQKEYNFTVIATDSSGISTHVSNKIVVGDVDDAAPRISSAASKVVAEGNVSGDVIYKVASEDNADIKGTDVAVSYALLAGRGSEQEAVADTQLVYVGGDTVQQGNKIDVAVNYLADSNELTGLGLRVHYDSSKLSFVAMNNLFADSLLFDSENHVNAEDPSASYVSVAWADYLQQADWTGGSLPELLFNAEFEVIASETSKSEISFSAIDTAQGYDFVGVSQELKLSPVSIDVDTGEVSLTTATDYESADEVSFTVVAKDALGNSSTQSVKVAIDNIDDTAPVITTETVTISLDEIHETDIGSHKLAIYNVAADDSHDINYGEVSYKLDSHDSSLAINSATGEVYFISHPDFEVKSQYVFNVVAEDAAGIQSSKQVTLNINNIDEQAPSFTSGSDAASVDENTVEAQLVYTAASTDDQDITANNTVYSLTSDSDGGFSVDANSGEVYFNEVADYELGPLYSFTVVATDAGGNSRSQTVNLAINNLDEEAPYFVSGSNNGSADENTTDFSLQVSALDDNDFSDGVDYQLIGDDAGLFDISDSGEITQAIETEFDYEAKSEYNFTVVATDDADNTNAESQQDITVSINNVDEIKPEITSSDTAQAVSDSAAVIYTATAKDSGDGSNGNITFSVTDESVVSIDEITGEVTLNSDADLSSVVDFTVVAKDDSDNSSEQAVSIPVISDFDTVTPSVTTGGIVHAYTHNADGTVTVKLSIADDTGIADQDITNLDFNLTYNSAFAGFDGYPDVIASNPDMHIATQAIDSNGDDIANTLSISQVYLNGYDTAAGLAIFEHTFDLPASVTGDLFTVSDLTMGESDAALAGSASSLDSLPDNLGTSGDDVVILKDGFANVDLGEGEDTLIIDSAYDANIVVDFASGEDSIDMTQILKGAGYGEGDALQVSGATPDIADLISNSDESLDNAFGGYFNNDADVLTLFVDGNSADGVTEIETIEVTLNAVSFDDEDISVNYDNFGFDNFIA